MKDFISRHAIPFSVIVILACDLGMQGLGALLKAIPRLDLDPVTVSLIVNAVFCLPIVALIHSLRWWGESGFRRPVTPRSSLRTCPGSCSGF